MDRNIFHLAIEGGELEVTLPFYTDVLSCELGPFEPGLWQDIDFWGHELTLHQTIPRKAVTKAFRQRHDVDMGQVCVPHFGIHIDDPTWQVLHDIIKEEYGFLDQPIVRFEGTDRQQKTFFVEDPNLNVLEIKTIQGRFYV